MEKFQKIKNKMKITKLLAPVGNWEMLTAAIEAGADEVYLGIKGINMRERANNFSIDELTKVCNYAHEHNVKICLTLNTIIYDNELNKVKEILTAAKKAKVDAIICWDMSVISMCKKLGLEIHLSTQASVSNVLAIKKYFKLGVKRFVLARECTLQQIKYIISEAKKISKKIEIETFIHGAMCVSESGRCFMSQFLYGNETSANRGKCIQPCRRSYIVRDTETNKELKLENNYVMSPKDLCTLPVLDQLLSSGINVFKIEGRARSPEYVKKVTEVYLEAINSFYENKLDKKLKNKLLEKLKTVYNRGFSKGFYMGQPINEWTDEYGSKATKKKTYIGKITNFYKKISVAEIKIESGKLNVGDNILVIGPTTGVHEQKIESIEIDKKKNIKSAKKGQLIGIKISKFCRKNDKVYLFE